MKNKYYIITIGCQMNKSDSERVAGVLEKLGLEWTNKRKKADLVVLTTCGVRQSAEDRVYGLVPKIKEENSKVKIILTGCLVNRKDVRKRLSKYVDVWLPINRITNYELRITNSNKKSNFGGPKLDFNSKILNLKSKINDCDYLNIKPKYSSEFSAFVPIGNGCNNFCTYCVVPYARGREVYRPAEEIIKEVKSLVKKGYKEIILIAQNVNSYKSEIRNPKSETNYKSQIQNSKLKSINFAKLLKIINSIPGDFEIGFATSHPKDMSDELIEAIANCHKVKKEIHLPIQSGDNEILKKMNRGYTVEKYKKLIKKIRKKIPGVKISTDVIVGFPEETPKQFKNTVQTFREIKFDKAYIAKYSPRPGTAAAKLKDDVPSLEKKERWKILNEIVNVK